MNNILATDARFARVHTARGWRAAYQQSNQLVKDIYQIQFSQPSQSDPLGNSDTSKSGQALVTTDRALSINHFWAEKT